MRFKSVVTQDKIQEIKKRSRDFDSGRLHSPNLTKTDLDGIKYYFFFT